MGFGKWLKSNNKKYVSRKGVTVKEFLLMHLLDGVWLNGEILRLYAELLVQEDARFQVIPAHTIDWELRTLNKPEGPNADTWATFDIDGQATTFLIPTWVNTNHWMLCVGKISDVNNKSGILDCYNALASSSQACQSAARRNVIPTWPSHKDPRVVRESSAHARRKQSSVCHKILGGDGWSVTCIEL